MIGWLGRHFNRVEVHGPGGTGFSFELRDPAAPGPALTPMPTTTAALAGPAVSLEAVNYRGSFLRHTRYEVVLGAYEDGDRYRRDATFVVRPSPAAPGGVRLESACFPGHVVRHRRTRLFLAPAPDDATAALDAAFLVRPGLAGGEDCVSLEAANFPGWFVRHWRGRAYIQAFDGAAVFRADATFRAGGGLA